MPSAMNAGMHGSVFFHEILRRSGIEYAFGIPGREAQILRWRGLKGIRWILTRNEFSAGIAAEVYARLTGFPQVAFSTFGPGATNMVTGVASACLDRAPLLAVSAQIELRHRLPSQTHQCIDQLAIMRPLVKYAAEVADAKELPRVVREALASALTEAPGPAYLSLPLDILDQQIPSRTACRALAGVRKPRGAPPELLDETSLRRLVRSIANSRQPVIVAGNEAIRDGACAQLANLCGRLRIPVLQTLAAKGVLPQEHPMNLGPVNRYFESLLRTRLLRRILKSADLIILAGFDLSEDFNPEMWRLGEKKKVARIGRSADAFEGYIGTDIAVKGSVREILARCSDEPGIGPPKETTALHCALRSLRARAIKGDWRPGSLLYPCRLVRALRDALGPDGILVSDVGLHKQYAGLFSETFAPNTFLCSNGLGLSASDCRRPSARNWRVRTGGWPLSPGTGAFTPTARTSRLLHATDCRS